MVSRVVEIFILYLNIAQPTVLRHQICCAIVLFLIYYTTPFAIPI